MYARDNVADANDLQKRLSRDSVVEAAAVVLSLLGDPTRLRLAVALLDGEQDVSALTAAVGAARPAVSQHLAKLRLAGLLRMRRDGRRAVYSLAGEHVRRLVTEVLRTAGQAVTEGRPAGPRPGP